MGGRGGQTGARGGGEAGRGAGAQGAARARTSRSRGGNTAQRNPCHVRKGKCFSNGKQGRKSERSTPCGMSAALPDRESRGGPTLAPGRPAGRVPRRPLSRLRRRSGPRWVTRARAMHHPRPRHRRGRAQRTRWAPHTHLVHNHHIHSTRRNFNYLILCLLNNECAIQYQLFSA